MKIDLFYLINEQTDERLHWQFADWIVCKDFMEVWHKFHVGKSGNWVVRVKHES